jgi:gamma-glutamyltranspeptidase / glutathione hydrolase
MDPRLAVAAGNVLSAQAGANVARAGGNAVDACLASAIMGWVAEPFFASLAGSGFIAIRAPGGVVEIIDGNNTMPHSPPDEPGQGITRVFLEYSNGMYTGIGGGSVGIPGILAAVRTAWERHGRIEWAALFEDAITVARDGFPFPKTSAYYLSVTWEAIWSQFEEAADVFSDEEGEPLTEGKLMIQSDLADALEEVAHQGPEAFYGGEIGESVVRAITAEGGWLNLGDLRSYAAEVRRPISTDAFGWKIETNPPPAVGGAVLAHMLALLDDVDLHVPVKIERLWLGAGGARSAVEQHAGRRGVEPDGHPRVARRHSLSLQHGTDDRQW